MLVFGYISGERIPMNGQLVSVSGSARKAGCNGGRSLDFHNRSIAEANARLKQGIG